MKRETAKQLLDCISRLHSIFREIAVCGKHGQQIARFRKTLDEAKMLVEGEAEKES